MLTRCPIPHRLAGPWKDCRMPVEEKQVETEGEETEGEETPLAEAPGRKQPRPPDY